VELAYLEKIRRTVIQAMVSDDELMDRLILKGGNALDLVYGIAARSSMDIDYSMADSFDDNELTGLETRIGRLLKEVFIAMDLVAHDIRLTERPQKLKPDLAGFWGGYLIEFKLLDRARFAGLQGDIDAARRNSLVVGAGNSCTFRIEISRHEHCPLVEERDFDGFRIHVYSPALIAIEKLRAICQQMIEYKRAVPTATSKPRAKDFFDIYTIAIRTGIDLTSEQNRQIIKEVFAAKKVPLGLLARLEESRDFHRLDYPTLADTLKPGEELKDFDFYFDFVKRICDGL
jgi:hypothetical protein